MALLTAENTVKDVEVRKIKAGTSEERTIYDVVDQAGEKWVAWERPLAERAYELKDQVSIWKVDVSTNGKYTNRTLKEIQAKPTEGFQPALDALSAQVSNGPLANPTITSTAPMGFPEAEKALVDSPSYRDRSIFRQTAAKVAGPMSEDAPTFWRNVTDLAEYFETGQTPRFEGAFGDPGPDVHVPAGPGGGEDDSIPFQPTL